MLYLPSSEGSPAPDLRSVMRSCINAAVSYVVSASSLSITQKIEEEQADLQLRIGSLLFVRRLWSSLNPPARCVFPYTWVSKCDGAYRHSGRDVRNTFSLWWFVFEGTVTLWLIQIQENHNTVTKIPHSPLSKAVQLSGSYGKILWSLYIEQAFIFYFFLFTCLILLSPRLHLVLWACR